MMVSCQPALSPQRVIILLNNVLIRCEDPCPALLQVDLDNAESWGMPWTVVDEYTLCKAKAASMERLPIQVELEVRG